MTSSATDEVATTTEVASALATLTPTELARLNMLAKVRARYAPGLDWRDLLHEAIDKALSGARRWPRHIPLLVFMRETMRSQASEHRRKSQVGVVLNESDLALRADGGSIITSAPSLLPDAERELAARQSIAQIHAAFAGDTDVIAILTGMADGLSPEEIQIAGNLSPTKYASAQKRIRRGLVRVFPKGMMS